MKRPLHPSNRNALLIILWGLLFMKCFILEYLVHHYSVPINSIIYIWSLSLFMATVATIVYFMLQVKQATIRQSLTPCTAIWCASLIAILLSVAIGLTAESMNLLLIPALIGLILGLAYCAQGLLQKEYLHLFSGFGWWVGAAILFRLDSLHALLFFALFIFLFTIIPAFIGILRRRREISRAMHALNA